MITDINVNIKSACIRGNSHFTRTNKPIWFFSLLLRDFNTALAALFHVVTMNENRIKNDTKITIKCLQETDRNLRKLQNSRNWLIRFINKLFKPVWWTESSDGLKGSNSKERFTQELGHWLCELRSTRKTFDQTIRVGLHQPFLSSFLNWKLESTLEA